MDSSLENRLRWHRERAELSQAVLAERSGISRQALSAIEAGRQIPSTPVSLRLAGVLGCSVEDLFTVPRAAVSVRVAPTLTSGSARPVGPVRLTLGRVQGSWVGHPLPDHGQQAADGVLSRDGDSGPGRAELWVGVEQAAANLLVAGCAPVLGALAQRVPAPSRDARMTWIPANSSRALDLLADGWVHVAGVHLAGEGSSALEDTLRRRFPDRSLCVVHLARWRQGLLRAAGNPRGITGPADLLRRDLTLALREPGAGATALFQRLFAAEGGAPADLRGLEAGGHLDVARLVASGAADLGIAIENAAYAFGLEFIPLSEEGFDLVFPAALLDHAPTERLLEALNAGPFRAELASLAGYDASGTGTLHHLAGAA